MKYLILTWALLLTSAVAFAADVNPEQDRQAYQKHFTEAFKEVPLKEFTNGVYAIDPEGRAQWEAIEEFPPYEIAIEKGETEWNTPFANGKTYQSCFKWPVAEGLRQHYPYFDAERKMVVTLERALNECREANGEEAFGWKKGKLVDLSAYVSFQSRGKLIKVQIEGADAKAAYAEGKQFYYAKRGQLNMSCADCHIYNAGNNVRADVLSPGLGHPSHFPVYRSKWDAMGSLHRRFGGCNNNIRAKPFKAQGKEYSNLEFFLTYMSNGLPYNGPGARK
ncbi:MAG: sulfur oxidation c-type cytochrome SoxA [bacterium]|nr:sulfur oxidation c-type cytochrome SoxA [bacterium]